jgi:sialate O-acetylesterase
MKWIRWTYLATPLGFIFGASFAMADVTLATLLADHMVVQRNLPVHVWGWAKPGESVTVKFRGETQSTLAGDVGQWSVYLKPGQAGGPFVLEVEASNHLQLQDVLVGDVWLASGQSNMEMPLNGLARSFRSIIPQRRS